jgi:hypothetical protein
MLDRYLDDLENRIDSVQELALEQEWTSFAEGRESDGPFSPSGRRPAPPTCDWPEININDAIKDDDLMLLSQFKLCSDHLASGSNLLMAVRTNYGVGIIPSFFGVEPFIMPYHMNCLPNVRPLPGGSQAFERLVSGSLPSLDQGYGPQIMRLAGRYQEIRRRYPKIGRFIRIDHPDGQGPFDIVELLWGSDVFYALYDDGELVHALLDHICRFYITFFDHWFQMMPPTDAYHAYFGRLHRGLITIRDDSAMNLSPALCREFVHPYDARLLEHFGGGAIHFCGRGDHYIADMVLAKGLSAIDLSQPHLNDMCQVISQTIDRGVNLHTVGSDNLLKIDLSAHARHRLSLR